MKRIVVFGVLLILTICFSFYVQSELDQCKDLLSVQVGQRVEPNECKVVLKDIQERIFTKDISVFMQTRVDVKNQRIVIRDVGAYLIDDQYFKLVPSVFVYGGFDAGLRDKATAAITDRLAIELFSTRECLGQTINIGEESYEITGVIKTDNSIMGFLSQTDKYRVYLSNESTLAASTGKIFTTFLIKVQPGSAAIQNYSFERLFSQKPGYAYTNFDMKARMTVQGMKLLFLVLLIFTIVILVKAFLWYVRASISCFIELNKEKYLLGVLHSMWLQILLGSLYAAGIAALVWCTIRFVGFEPYIPATLLPDRLVDLQGFVERLSAYIIDQNTRIPVISDYSSLILAASRISNAISIIAFISFYMSATGLRRTYMEYMKSGIKRNPIVRLFHRSNCEG